MPDGSVAPLSALLNCGHYCALTRTTVLNVMSRLPTPPAGLFVLCWLARGCCAGLAQQEVEDDLIEKVGTRASHSRFQGVIALESRETTHEKRAEAPCTLPVDMTPDPRGVSPGSARIFVAASRGQPGRGCAEVGIRSEKRIFLRLTSPTGEPRT